SVQLLRESAPHVGGIRRCLGGGGSLRREQRCDEGVNDGGLQFHVGSPRLTVRQNSNPTPVRMTARGVPFGSTNTDSSDRMNARPLSKYDLNPAPTNGRASTERPMVSLTKLNGFERDVSRTVSVQPIWAPTETYGCAKTFS